MTAFHAHQFAINSTDDIAKAVDTLAERLVVEIESLQSQLDQASATSANAFTLARRVKDLEAELEKTKSRMGKRIAKVLSERDDATQMFNMAKREYDAQVRVGNRLYAEKTAAEQQVAALQAQRDASGTADYYRRELEATRARMADLEESGADLKRLLMASTQREAKLRANAVMDASAFETETLYAVRFDSDVEPMAYLQTPLEANQFIDSRMSLYGFPRDNYHVTRVQVAISTESE